ncbi:MAG: hypothetical protein WC849_00510 [Candidatus Paceibacterota bacterium]
MEKEKEKEIGVITHWFDKINVAVIKLNGSIKKGDKIKIRKGDTEFEETIDSMQIDHQNVDSAKKGDDVAIRFSEKTKEGALVYPVK